MSNTVKSYTISFVEFDNNNVAALSSDITGFVAKNNFSLQDDLTELLVSTSDPFLSSLFARGVVSVENAAANTDGGGRRGGGAKKRTGAVTLSSQFRQQVDSLMALLRSTDPHYIKVSFPEKLLVKREQLT
jgi:myosin heavy subunit